jgi:hypothetical protein
MVAKNFNLMVLMKMDPQKDGIFQGLDRKSFEILSEKSSRYPFLQNFHADDKKDSFVVVDDASNQISSLISLLNRALDTEETLSEFEGDEIISEIRRTGKKLRSVDEKWHKCDEVFCHKLCNLLSDLQLMNELNYKYNSIADKTSSLHDACNQMLSQQTQLAAIAMQV